MAISAGQLGEAPPLLRSREPAPAVLCSRSWRSPSGCSVRRRYQAFQVLYELPSAAQAQAAHGHGRTHQVKCLALVEH